MISAVRGSGGAFGAGEEGDAEQNDDAKQDFERTHHCSSQNASGNNYQ